MRITTNPLLQVPPAAPALAARHFAHRLSLETDPADVWTALTLGSPGVVLVDTRRPEAYLQARLPGAVNLPHAEVDERTTATLDRNALYVTYCWGPACNASTKGAAALAGLGFKVKEMVGGLEAWQREGYPVETGAPVEADLRRCC